MQVQCGDVTYFVVAPALGVANQVVCYSRPLNHVIGGSFPTTDIRLDMNSAHQLLGLAWRGAPQEVTSTIAIEANAADRVAVLWLSPLCKCATHKHTYVSPPPYAFRLTLATNTGGASATEVCYIKVWAK